MSIDLSYLEGRKICVVFCQLKDEETFKTNQENPEEMARLCFEGGTHDGKYLKVRDRTLVPPSAYEIYSQMSGTDLLEDAEYCNGQNRQ